MTQGSDDANKDLRGRFLAHLEGYVDGSVLPADLDLMLQRLLEAGRSAWPDLALAPDRFVEHLAQRVSAGRGLEASFAETYAADLYLACACQRDVSGAIARFDEAFRPTINAFVRQIDPSPAFADEVRQILWLKLFVAGADGAPAKIAGYLGRGQLSSWVGVAAQRTALGLVRGRSAREQAGQDALADALPAGVDPELDYLKMRYRAEFRQAFQAAFAALPPRERVVLRLHLVKGLSHESIAGMYQVNQSTVTRWIARARELISADAQRHLRERLDISTEEFHSLGHLVASQLDLSVTRWLGED